MERGGNWNKHNCVSHINPDKPAKYLVFSVETLGQLIVRPKDTLDLRGADPRLPSAEFFELRNTDFALFRIDGEGRDIVHYTNVVFHQQLVSDEENVYLYYSKVVEPGTYAIEVSPAFENEGRFEVFISFWTLREAQGMGVEAIVQTFESQGSRKLDQIVDTGDVRIVFIPYSTSPHCVSSSDDRPVIVLPRPLWIDLSPHEREQALFHELGHCYLGRDHDESTTEGGRMKSVMATWLFDKRIYRRRREEYIEELFDTEKFGVWSTSLLHVER